MMLQRYIRVIYHYSIFSANNSFILPRTTRSLRRSAASALLQPLSEPELDQRLARYPQTLRFPVERLHHPEREIDKEEILATLIEELDGPPDEGVEAAWLEEAERRGREIDSGAVECIPAKDVFATLDKILGK